MTSSHDYKKDRRNDKIKIFVNGKFLDRNNAKISVFDSGFLLGDGVWSGIRLHNGKLLFLTSTPYQDPAFTISKPTIVIIPEYKKPDDKLYKKGLILKTVKTIRGPKNVQDPVLNTLSKLNCILACIEAKKNNADEALMHDINGNIATNNSTHFFFIKDNKVYTSTGNYCVKGITRKNVIDICKSNKIRIYQKNFKLKDVMKADEAFVTGTFANIIPVKKINNKKFSIKKSNLTFIIRNLYLEKINNY